MKTGALIPGRGTATNPDNRFEAIAYEPDPEAEAFEESRSETQFINDGAHSLITYNESPDVGFDASINPYRGCEHGCVYCYARPTHEYLGFSAGLDFETRIMVKAEAPELLRRELSSQRWKPQVVAISGGTDAYQPVERRLELTRRCLEVFVEFRNPVAIITKNELVTRDLDLLSELARVDCVVVYLSISTLDAELSRRMEPRTSVPQRRLMAISRLAGADIPTGVLVAPVIPGLTDHEIPNIVSQASKAGARYAGLIPLRLPHGVKDLFENWLSQHLPDRKKKVLNRIRAIRGGHLNDPDFNSRMDGDGVFADEIKELFALGCWRAGINGTRPVLSIGSFRRPPDSQLVLFE